MFLRRHLIRLSKELLDFEHPTLEAIREVIARGKVVHEAKTHPSPPHEMEIARNQAALTFAFNAKKVPLVPTAPTVTIPLADLVKDGAPHVGTSISIVDGWVWRVVFEAKAQRFPKWTIGGYRVDPLWTADRVPDLVNRDYSKLNSATHRKFLKIVDADPNGDPAFAFEDWEEMECLFQLYSTVQIGAWTWSAPDDSSELDVIGAQYKVIARDDSGNYLGVRKGSPSIWELNHERQEPVEHEGSVIEFLKRARASKD